MSEQIREMIGQLFEVDGTHPQGDDYSHGVCKLTDLWCVSGYGFGLRLESVTTGGGWIWPGIDSYEIKPDGITLHYTGGIPVRPAKLRMIPFQPTNQEPPK